MTYAAFLGIFAFMALTTVVPAQAEASFFHPNKSYEEMIFEGASKLNEKMFRFCRDCSTAEAPTADRVCQQQYDKIYQKGEVNIHMAFGYMDSSEVLGGGVYGKVKLQPNQSVDEVSSYGLINQLLKPCGYRRGACGFHQHASDPDVFVKSVNYLGRPVLIKIRITHASATPFFDTNVGPEADFQATMTEVSEKNFFESLGDSDLSIYTGHARGGGGPDFNPPILTSEGKVNYDGYYRRVRPGLKHLLSSLKSASRRPSLLAILGCKTDPLFKDPVLSVAPEMGLITTTDLTYFEDGFRNTYLVIDAFLKNECGATFQKTLQQVRARNGARLVMTNFLDSSR